MARKLSRIARNSALMLLAACSLSATVAWAQRDVRVSSPSTVIRNPYADGDDQQPVVVPEESDSPRRGTATFHNPFALKRVPPPLDFPLRSGPISRWQSAIVPADEPSSIKSAILSTHTVARRQTPWLQSPGDVLAPGTDAASDSPGGSDVALPPDPIQFAPRQLTQPAWLDARNLAAQPLPRTDASDATVHATADPFELPARAAGSPNPTKDELARYAVTGEEIPGRTLLDLRPADAGLLPQAVSDCVDSPEGWYADAQQAAQSAQSSDELTRVAEFCQRGLSCAPTQDLACSLRRLAAWAINRRGELNIEAGRQQEALQDFERAITLDSDCWLAIHNRGVTRAQQNQPAAALRDFNRVVELNPGLAVAYRNRAELLASMGRMNEAVRDYSQALEQQSDDAELLAARGDAWQRLGDFDRALADMNEAVRLAPEVPDAYTLRGNLAAEQSQFDQAIADYQEALRIDPNCAEACRSLAWLQATCPNPRYRNTEQALTAAHRAVKQSSIDDCFLLDALAAAQANAGRFDEAVKTQQHAVAIAPPDLAGPLRDRLTLYQQGHPYRSGPPSAVRTTSHEAAPAPPKSPTRLR